MGEDGPSDETKLEILWRAYTSQERQAQAPKPLRQTVNDNFIQIVLIGAVAFGSGPDVIKTILQFMVGR